MTISRQGKFAAVTNYRDLANIRDNAVSRGEIPTNFLLSDQNPAGYIDKLHEHSEAYNGFNVLVADEKQMVHYSNYERKLNELSPGVYGLSNALLDTRWPKVERAKSKFEALLGNSFGHGELIDMMGDTTLADDEVLPDTGVSREMEKSLSAMCIRMENYGTCCTTAITVDRDGRVVFTEKSYPVGGRKARVVGYEFKIGKNE